VQNASARIGALDVVEGLPTIIRIEDETLA
jgi:hypothetical protein